MGAPTLSVIIPARNAERVLPGALDALSRNDLPRDEWELIVVDDGSTDATAAIARRHADHVVELHTDRPCGPAFARNRGAEVARGHILVFLDADTCAHPDTLRKFARLFADDRTLGAAFGSYDAHPPAPSFVSQYRNLLHHFVHQRSPGEAETFWAGCGAVRRVVLIDAGMFDEWHFSRPQIEDVEIGSRIRARGYRILLRPDIQVTHRKHWTFGAMLRTDLLDRGIPWTRLLVQQRAMTRAAALNLRPVEKAKTVLLGLAILASAMGLLTGAVAWHLASLGAVLAVVGASAPFYLFLARLRGSWFALRAIPLHLLYYVLNGVAVASGYLLHHLVGEPRPDPVTEARAEVGFSVGPVPRKGLHNAWS